MLHTIKASTKLYLLVLVLCGFITGIGMYGIHELEVMNKNTESLYTDRVFPLQQLTDIRYLYLEGILNSTLRANDKNVAYSKILAELEQAEKAIANNWQHYQQTYLTPGEKKLAGQVAIQMETVAATTAKVKTGLAAKKALKEAVRKELSLNISQLVSELNELIQVQVSMSGELNKYNAQVYKATTRKFYISIALALLFAFGISFFIIRDLQALIKTLRAANLKVIGSEAKLRTFIEHAGDAIFMINENTIITDVNGIGCSMLGYSKEELTGMSIAQVVQPDELDKQAKYFEEVRSSTSRLNERRLKRKDGSAIDVEVNTRMLEGSGYISIIRDVTERKKAEEERKKSEENYRTLFEQASDIIVLTDLQGLILDANASTTQLLGYTSEELIGRTIASFIDPKELQIDPVAIPQVREGTHIIRRRKIIKKNGEIIELENNSKRIFGDRILLIGRDITELRKAEKQITQSEEKYRAVTENITDAIVLTDRNNQIIYRSPSVGRITGYTAEEAMSMSMLDFIHADEKEATALSFLKSFNAPGVPVHFTTRIRHKEGHLLWIEGTSLNMFHNENLQAFITNFRDITERKIAEELLRENEERYKSIISVSNTGAWEFHSRTGYLWCSPEYFTMLGRSQADYDMTGKSNLKETWVDLLHPDDREKADNSFAQYLKNGSVGMYESYFRMQHNNGSWVWIWSRGQTLRDAQGNLTDLTVGTHIDITERINAEKEKQEIQERSMAMLEEKVVERTEELYETNRVLNQRNHEITDSINYAQNIQRAVLSKAEDCRKIFPDSFVLWMPKDAVSGDFYWCYSNQKYGFIAAVDCTGHGVPGALMSIIASQMLDRVVNTYGFVDPGQILFHLDDAMVSSLKQETGTVKDGMDIALCRVDKENKILTFAGAQRPLFYYDGTSLNEIPGNKMGVGGFMSGNYLKTFTQTEIHYKEGDCFYLTSDGYYSQFGGEKKKKLMKKRFKEYLTAVVHLPVIDQKRALRKYYADWQGKEEQVDDVLVIGMRM